MSIPNDPGASAPEFDYAPFPEPFPEDSVFSPITSDDRKEWRKAKAKWEAIHGVPPRSSY